MSEQSLNDESLMPFGKHKGERMADVPDSYLKWFWREYKEHFEKGKPMPINAKMVMRYVKDSFNENEL